MAPARTTMTAALVAVAVVGCRGKNTTEADAGATPDGHDAGATELAPDGAVHAPPGAGLGCNVIAPRSCPDPAPLYRDVAPIIERHCVECHSGVSDLWPLTSYSHVADWGPLIRAELLTCGMPPPESGERLPDDESHLILEWVLCGTPVVARE